MKILALVEDWLFPRKCTLCGCLLTPDETDLCSRCRREEAPYPDKTKNIPFVKSWCALWHYSGNVRQSIRRYKFKGQKAYADAYGRLLAMKLLESGLEYDILTWIPISSARKARRGFDQTKRLAMAVGKELGTPPLSTLKKIRNNRPQSGISGLANRRANVLGVYRTKDPDLIRGKRILLLDDIITTGATSSEAARILLTAGAKEVHCAAIAAASNHHNEQVKK